MGIACAWPWRAPKSSLRTQLSEAVGCRGKVKVILSGVSHVETEDERAARLLCEGARSGDLSKVSWLDVDVNGLSDGGETPLHYAAGQGHWAAVCELLKRGARINARTNTGATPLHKAVAEGHCGVVRELLSSGADVNAVTASKGSALHLAAVQGEAQILRELLSWGADATHAPRSFTPLRLANQLGRQEVASILEEWDVILSSKTAQERAHRAECEYSLAIASAESSELVDCGLLASVLSEAKLAEVSEEQLEAASAKLLEAQTTQQARREQLRAALADGLERLAQAERELELRTNNLVGQQAELAAAQARLEELRLAAMKRREGAAARGQHGRVQRRVNQGLELRNSLGRGEQVLSGEPSDANPGPRLLSLITTARAKGTRVVF